MRSNQKSEKSDDGRKQDWTEPPGWSWLHRQTGPEVSESSPREGESGEAFKLAQFIFRTAHTCVSPRVCPVTPNETHLSLCKQ